MPTHSLTTQQKYGAILASWFAGIRNGSVASASLSGHGARFRRSVGYRNAKAATIPCSTRNLRLVVAIDASNRKRSLILFAKTRVIPGKPIDYLMAVGPDQPKYRKNPSYELTGATEVLTAKSRFM